MAPLKRGQNGSKAINAALEDLATLPEMTVAQATAAGVAAANKNKMIYVSNGAAGQPCLAYSNGTSWLRILLGAAVATT